MIFSWVNENKEWLFSGVGVSLFLALIYILRCVKKKLGNYGPRQNPFDQVVYKPNPLPAKMTSIINKSEPFQIAVKAESFIGLKISWLTTFETSHTPNSNGCVKLMLLDRGHYPWVYCTVNINEYPEIKSAKKHSKIWLAGEIKKVDGGGIDVEVHQLQM
jgi:hypothetical protein